MTAAVVQAEHQLQVGGKTERFNENATKTFMDVNAGDVYYFMIQHFGKSTSAYYYNWSIKEVE